MVEQLTIRAGYFIKDIVGLGISTSIFMRFLSVKKRNKLTHLTLYTSYFI